MLTLASEVDAPAEVGGREGTARRRRRLVDLASVLVYVLGGVYVTLRLWVDPARRVLSGNVQDHGFFQFTIAHSVHAVLHLQNPLFTNQVDVPNGINMMANTSILGIAIPMIPVTLLFGPAVSFIVIDTLMLAATATAWYWVFSRHLVRSRLAAFLAGAFCGFSPGFISQANGHPNVAGQFMVPLILLQVIRLKDSRRPLVTGAVLGLLVVYQAFVNEEVLLFTAMAGALLVLVWAVSRWSQFRAAVRPGLIGLGSAAVVAGVLLAYPLYFQFTGPEHYGSVPAVSVSYYSDLGSYFNYATRSIAGASSTEIGLHAHLAEENSYLGWPLLILSVVAAIWMWRNVLVRAAFVVAVVFAGLSLGPVIKVYGHNTHIPGPFRLINWMPVLDAIVPVRLALMVGPAVGVLLAFLLDRLIMTWREAGSVRLVWAAAVAAALLPLAPTPLPARDLPPTPAFVADGMWKQYVTPGHTVVPVPLPNIGHLEGQRWSAVTNLDMPIPGGYFLGPAADGSKRGLYGAPPRPTYTLLNNIGWTGKVPLISDADRANMVTDLKYWHASVVVLGDIPHAYQVLTAMTQLLGQPQSVGGVWLWDVRMLVNG